MLYPAFRMQELMQRQSLGSSRWKHVNENVERHRQIQAFRELHRGRRPPRDLKSRWQVFAEKARLRRKLAVCHPEYVDALRPATEMRNKPGAATGGKPGRLGLKVKDPGKATLLHARPLMHLDHSLLTQVTHKPTTFTPLNERTQRLGKPPMGMGFE